MWCRVGHVEHAWLLWSCDAGSAMWNMHGFHGHVMQGRPCGTCMVFMVMWCMAMRNMYGLGPYDAESVRRNIKGCHGHVMQGRPCGTCTAFMVMWCRVCHVEHKVVHSHVIQGRPCGTCTAFMIMWCRVCHVEHKGVHGHVIQGRPCGTCMVFMVMWCRVGHAEHAWFLWSCDAGSPLSTFDDGRISFLNGRILRRHPRLYRTSPAQRHL